MPRLTQAQWQDLARRHLEGASLGALAEEVGLDRSYVGKQFKARGFKINNTYRGKTSPAPPPQAPPDTNTADVWEIL